MATYATNTSGRRADDARFVRVELRDIPPSFTAGDFDSGEGLSSVNALSLTTTRSPAGYTGSNETDGFVPTLTKVTLRGESIDPTKGTTSLGSITVEATDTADGKLAAIFSPKSASKVGSLSADVAVGDANISVEGASISDGQPLFLGAETIIAQNAVSGSGTLTAPFRGANACNSTRRAHLATTTATAHADDIYDRPRVWRRRLMALYLNYTSLAKSSEVLYGLYLVSRAPEYTDGVWRITGDSYLTILDQKVGRTQYNGAILSSDYEAPSFEAGQSIVVTVDDNGNQPAFSTAADTLLLMADEEVIETTVVSNTGGHILCTIDKRGAVDTPRSELAQESGVKEVISSRIQQTTPRFGSKTYTASWSALSASDHPLVIFLNLLLSRDGANLNTANGSSPSSGDVSYDVLPSPWGINVPYATVDIDAFEEVIDQTAGAHFGNFIIGDEGAFSLMEWFKDEVAPVLGVALFTNTSGQISITRIDQFYPLDTATAIDLDDIDQSYLPFALQPRVNLGRSRIEYTTTQGRRPVTLNTISALARELFPDENREVKIKSKGAGSEAFQFLHFRGLTLIAKEVSAQASTHFKLPWALHNTITPGTRITITDAGMPNDSGSYGVTTQEWLALSTQLEIGLDGSQGVTYAGVSVNAIRLDTGAAHWGPAASVTTGAAGATTLTLAANAFCPSSRPTGSIIPTKDVAAFGPDGSQGGAGASVAVYNTRGVRQDDNGAEIVSISYASNQVTISQAFQASMVNIATAGLTLRLAPLTATIKSGVSGGTLWEDQLAFMAVGDSSDGSIDTGVLNYRWGG